ncbi:hypothetical protein ADUPG1_013321 [Aduncisulcus paluster]|uniref:Hydroxymethylglutaryl-CoA synthase n=1 Tax=Aduncisulcus paluster TaxID=2918883 RepID=A0ABQ5K2I4_9EUKA|nr:hypothetical protein ADUPG1_013321 [Aduncisulcus paluster]
MSVGIHRIEVVLPKFKVDNRQLEKAFEFAEGYITIGLGQKSMSAPDADEDCYSLALTATKKLLDNIKIDKTKIKKLVVGTESQIDRAKPISTFLLPLFSSSSDYSEIKSSPVTFSSSDDSSLHFIECHDSVAACYGGSCALFECCDWCRLPEHSDEYAVVVAVDTAVYDNKNYISSGGCGAVAMLIGSDAPLSLLPSRVSICEHMYDFYKPCPSSPFPLVESRLSVECYMKACLMCYIELQKKQRSGSGSGSGDERIIHSSKTVKDFSLSLFHTPFSKMVQRAHALLVKLDSLPSSSSSLSSSSLSSSVMKEWVTSKDIVRASVKEVKKDLVLIDKLNAALALSSMVGNTYSAAIFLSLASGIATQLLSSLSDEDKEEDSHDPKLEHLSAKIGNEILVFSYGSGFTASMYVIRQSHTDISGVVDRGVLKYPLEQEEMTAEDYRDNVTKERIQCEEEDYVPIPRKRVSGRYVLSAISTVLKDISIADPDTPGKIYPLTPRGVKKFRKKADVEPEIVKPIPPPSGDIHQSEEEKKSCCFPCYSDPNTSTHQSSSSPRASFSLFLFGLFFMFSIYLLFPCGLSLAYSHIPKWLAIVAIVVFLLGVCVTLTFMDNLVEHKVSFFLIPIQLAIG